MFLLYIMKYVVKIHSKNWLVYFLPHVNSPQYSCLVFFKLVLTQKPFFQVNNSSADVIPVNNPSTCWVYADPLNPFFWLWDNTGRSRTWFVPLETETWDYSIKDVLLWNCCNYWIPASLSSPSQAPSAVSLDPAKAWAPARGGDGLILPQATHSQVTHLQIN